MARGLLAELNRMARAAQREAARREKAAAREHNAAIRRTEQAIKAERIALAGAARANEADRKRMEREAKAAHVLAQEAEAEERNAALTEIYESIDTLLAATLEVDDYVDLGSFKRTIEHPPFDRDVQLHSHLGAAVSKAPLSLVAADTTGIRQS
jgi:restriction system protein